MDKHYTTTRAREGSGPRVAIIGGGPSGLFTAYLLNQHMPTAQITIFEASEECGGKMCTAEFSDGTPFEVGVGELYEHLCGGGVHDDPLRLFIENDLKLKTVDISGGSVIFKDRILSDLDEVECVHGYDTRKRIEAFYHKCAELMPPEEYAQQWHSKEDHPWAGKTFRECIEEELCGLEGVDEVARDYIETAVASDLGTESHTCSGLCGIKHVLMDNPEYVQPYHVAGGIGQVVERLLDGIDAEVSTSTRVTRVVRTESDDNRYRVDVLEVTDALTESSHEFDAVVVALPSQYLRAIKWEGKLALAIHGVVAQHNLMAHYLRVSMLFDTKWWAELNVPGESWTMDMLNGCCCYDESKRWTNGAKRRFDPDRQRDEKGRWLSADDDTPEGGHVLSFLLSGSDALLLANEDSAFIVDHVLQSLPTFMREDAESHLTEAQVDRYVGSTTVQHDGWPEHDQRCEHIPEPVGHPGVFLVGDYFFDSTVNASLTSANIVVELLMEFLGVDSTDEDVSDEEDTD